MVPLWISKMRNIICVKNFDFKHLDSSIENVLIACVKTRNHSMHTVCLQGSVLLLLLELGLFIQAHCAVHVSFIAQSFPLMGC